MRNVLRMAFAMCLAAGPLAAQWVGDDEDSVFSESLPGAAAVTPQVAMHRCLALGTDAAGPAVAWRGRGCSVRSWSELKAVAGERFFVAVYALASDGSGAAGRELRGEETVLFSRAPGASRLTPTWHAVFITEFIGLVEPDVAATPGGGVLMAANACWNGTGGCSQRLLLRRGQRWQVVSEPWLRSLPSWMRSGFNKGTHVDPHTLRASASLYSPRDANCCPSRQVSARLALRGTRLVLLGYRVSPFRS